MHFLIRSLCENAQISSGRSYLITSGTFDISYCSFSRSTGLGINGGVIYCVGESNLNVSDCAFYKCSTSGASGGAIYFSASNCNMVRICGMKCKSTSNYHFSFISGKYESKFNFNYISIASCGDLDIYESYHCIYLQKGYQSIYSLNSSKNIIFQPTSLCIDDPSSFHGTRCTFANNRALHSIVIWFMGGTDTRILDYSNILNNNQDTSTWAIVYCHYGSSDYNLDHCMFYGNQNTLFTKVSGSITVSNCEISHSGSLGTYIDGGNNIEYSSSLKIQHYSTELCDAEIPLMPKTHVLPYSITSLQISIFCLLF